MKEKIKCYDYIINYMWTKGSSPMCVFSGNLGQSLSLNFDYQRAHSNCVHPTPYHTFFLHVGNKRIAYNYVVVTFNFLLHFSDIDKCLHNLTIIALSWSKAMNCCSMINFIRKGTVDTNPYSNRVP